MSWRAGRLAVLARNVTRGGADVKRIMKDFLGIWRICGVSVALRWIYALVANWKVILTEGNLQVADHAVGIGPFNVTLTSYGASFRITGCGAMSGIREMYVRDTYLRNRSLVIRDGDCVLDLGANMGNFSNLALACGPRVHVVAVEPSRDLNLAYLKSVGQNAGFLGRVNLIRGLLGEPNDKIEAAIRGDSNYSDAPWLSEQELLSRAEIERVDFLKCDIEGGEFGLLSGNSKLLSMVRSLAIEIHAFAGDVPRFIQMLERVGFRILSCDYAPDGSATVAALRT